MDHFGRIWLLIAVFTQDGDSTRTAIGPFYNTDSCMSEMRQQYTPRLKIGGEYLMSCVKTSRLWYIGDLHIEHVKAAGIQRP
jgi:hypothetical protein